MFAGTLAVSYRTYPFICWFFMSLFENIRKHLSVGMYSSLPSINRGVVEMNAMTDESYLQKAVRLYTTSKSLLAMKAYERALSAPEGELVVVQPLMPFEYCSPMPRDVLFRYFLLHCNAFSVGAIEVSNALAEDFLRLCLDNLEKRNYVQKDLLTKSLEDAREGNSYDGDSANLVDEGISFLISITLNNLGCLLIRSGDLDRAIFSLELALEYAIPQELVRIILLNMCAVHLRKCSFHEVRAAAMEVCEEERLKSEEGTSDSSVHIAESNKDLNRLLIAFAYFNMGIAGEYLFPPDAEKYYANAETAMVGNPYQQWSKIIEATHRRFQTIVQKRNDAVVRQPSVVTEADTLLGLEWPACVTPPAGGKARTSMQVSKTGITKGKMRNSAISTVSDFRIDLFKPPEISEEIRWTILHKGLGSVIIPLIGSKEAEEYIFGAANAYSSPLPSVAFGSLTCVAMLSLWEGTPLQIVDEAEGGRCAFSKRSVWSLYYPHSDEGSIVPPGKAKPSLVPSPSVAGVVKSIIPVPPLSEKTINDALRNVMVLKKVLNSRLAVLVQAENAFEEKWMATLMVKKALIAFNFVQDFIKLRESMKKSKLMQEVLERTSARRIIRFLRVVLEAKKYTEAPVQPLMRIRYFEGKSAVILQRTARAWLARRKLQALRAEKQTELLRIVKIQGLYRGRTTRKMFIKYREGRQKELSIRAGKERCEFAARQIQSAYRRHALLLSTWLATGQFKRYILHHYRYSREHSATVIQKCFRGFLIRRDFGNVVRARRCYGRNCYRSALLNTIATKIQAIFRGYAARRRLRMPLQQLRLKRSQEELDRNKHLLHKTAIVIQCAYRRYASRKIYAQLNALRDRDRLLRRNRIYSAFRLEDQLY
uniref:Uncharacterized protein n=1 Tax=Trypanosoma congolense (strain IL3000) TaxID=1068625 RepID=G0UST8_TRYCI|nr:conserved hypothetical protein [Trypanosoma congolense IL3000]